MKYKTSKLLMVGRKIRYKQATVLNRICKPSPAMIVRTWFVSCKKGTYDRHEGKPQGVGLMFFQHKTHRYTTKHTHTYTQLFARRFTAIMQWNRLRERVFSNHMSLMFKHVLTNCVLQVFVPLPNHTLNQGESEREETGNSTIRFHYF